MAEDISAISSSINRYSPAASPATPPQPPEAETPAPQAEVQAQAIPAELNGDVTATEHAQASGTASTGNAANIGQTIDLLV